MGGAFHKMKRLYPHYIFSFMLMFFWTLLKTPQWHNIGKITFFANTFIELLGLQILLPYSSLINGIGWYVSVIILLVPLLIALIIINEKLAYFLSFIMSISVYSFFISKWTHVDFGFVWIGFMNGGLLRGIGGLFAGILLFYVYSHVKNIQFNKITYNLFSFLQILFICFIFVYSWNYRQKKNADAILIILIAVCILMSFIDNGFLTNKLIKNEKIKKIIKHFGKLSYPIYLYQTFVAINVTSMIKIENKAIQSALYIVILIIFSELTNYIIILLHKLNIKKIFIQEQV